MVLAATGTPDELKLFRKRSSRRSYAITLKSFLYDRVPPPGQIVWTISAKRSNRRFISWEVSDLSTVKSVLLYGNAIWLWGLAVQLKVSIQRLLNICWKLMGHSVECGFLQSSTGRSLRMANKINADPSRPTWGVSAPALRETFQGTKQQHKHSFIPHSTRLLNKQWSTKRRPPSPLLCTHSRKHTHTETHTQTSHWTVSCVFSSESFMSSCLLCTLMTVFVCF